jgi:hypothetical protein
LIKKHLFILFVLITFGVQGQELNCSVQVLSDQIQTSDKRIFTTMETAILEFMNNRKWTKDEFQNHEKIECSILINITDRPATNSFNATIQIQSRRPVYNSSYKSIVFKNKDTDFDFEYLEYQPLDFSETSYLNNLTSVLSFYAYTILGFDYDSFSLEGGQKYFNIAETIMINAQTSNNRGWSSGGSQNRFTLINQLRDPRYRKFRKAIYEYHRLGLDNLYTSPEKGRGGILQALKNIKAVYDDNPVTFLNQIFFNAKSDEIISIYSEAMPIEKIQLKKILLEIDGVNSEKYNKL